MTAAHSFWRLIGLLALLATLATTGCRRETSTQSATGSNDRPLVYVSIPPQRYFVERIAGDHVRIGVLLKPGQSMHTYEPTPKQMVELSSAKVYFRIGAPFENQVADKIGQTIKTLQLVDTNAGITLREQTEACDHEDHADEHADHHDHDTADEHAHHELDMHTWTNPRLVKIQARNICDALIRIDPAQRSDYEANLASFQSDLNQLDAEIADSLKPLAGRAFFVFHPAFGYFADAYNLHQIAIETAGREPTAKDLAQLIDRAKADNVKLIFVQPQFSKRGAEAVAEAIGGAVVPLDHLAENYIDNLRHVAAEIKRALAAATSSAKAPASRSS